MIVTGIGQCSLDYLAVVDSYPSVDTKKEVLHWEEQGGGPVATALVALSRLGIRCMFHGIIGDDEPGSKIRRSLITDGIGVEGLIERDHAASQVAFIAIDEKTGTRTIFWKRPSGEELRPDELGSPFLHQSNFLLLDGLMKDVSLFAAKKANSLKIPVMLDAGRLREGMVDIARSSDYIIASEEFAKDLGWDGDPEILRKNLASLGSGVITITLGKRGSITYLNNEMIHIPAFDVETVDTTGAGDVFHGGYVFGLLNGWNVEDTVRFASAMAAMKCTKIGGRAGIPTFEGVIQFLSEKGYAIRGDIRKTH
jgi:ribokinase